MTIQSLTAPGSWSVPSQYLAQKPQLGKAIIPAIERFDLAGVMKSFGSRFTPINYTPLSLEASRQVAERIAQDSHGNIRVLFVNGRTQVWQYNSRFMIKEHHVNPPYIVFLENRQPIIVKPLKDRFLPIHRVSEVTGTSLLRAIGAETFSAVKGDEFEYLEILPGDTFYDLIRNSDEVELLNQRDFMRKLHFLLGIAIADAFIFSLGDRNSNIIMNFDIIKATDHDLEFLSLLQNDIPVVANIDTASAFNPDTMAHPSWFFAHVFFHASMFLRESVRAIPGTVLIDDPQISLSFLHGLTLRHSRLRSTFKSGGIIKESIMEILKQEFDDPAPYAELIFSRLSLTDDEVLDILSRALVEASEQHALAGQHALMPITL